jgi:hypothetical protein
MNCVSDRRSCARSAARLCPCGITFAILVAFSDLLSVPCLAQTSSSFSFERQDIGFLPIISNFVASAGPEDRKNVEDATNATASVFSFLSTEVGSQEADGIATAFVNVPVDASTSGPTADVGMFVHAEASGIASAGAGLNETSIVAPASFIAHATGEITAGYLHGFLYIAEGGGFTRGSESARATTDGRALRAEINGTYADGSVVVGEDGVKHAFLSTSLPGVQIQGDVGSINYLFHFVTPISDGTAATMESRISEYEVSANSGLGSNCITPPYATR